MICRYLQFVILKMEIKFAIAEERLNRQKNYKGFPERSLQYLLKNYNLK